MNLFRLTFVAALAIGSVTGLPAQEVTENVSKVELDPEAIQIAREIMDIAYPEDTRIAMFNAISETMFEQTREAMVLLPDDPEKQKILDIFQRNLLDKSKPIMDRNIPKLMDGWAKAYANMFTKAELVEVLAFVKTEAGQKVFGRSAEIMSDPYYVAPMKVYFTEIGELQRVELAKFVSEMRASGDEATDTEDPQEPEETSIDALE